jgi:Kef-type K+ transport system membrane component KefB
MTRAAIVLGLVIGLTFAARSFLPEGVTINGSGAALAFGFLLLAALQTGHIFHALRLPHLTGFLLCGAIFGPQVLNLITEAMVRDLSLVKRVAVGLIALNAGCELNFRTLRPKLGSISLISFFGLTSAAILIFAVVFLCGHYLSHLPGFAFMADRTLVQRAIIALVCTNVLIALSPAVVMGILSETHAKGPLSELCLSIVVLADLLVAITFSFSDSAVRSVFPELGGSHSILGGLAVHILGSMAVGSVVGLIFAVYIRRVGVRVGLFVFAVCFVVAEAGTSLHLDPLLVGLSAGLFLENVSPVSGHEVIRQTEPAAMPTFAVFFAVIGAEVHLDAFLAVAPFAVATAGARALGILTGSRVGAKLARVEPAIARRGPFGMFPQAGIALALASLVQKSFPPWGVGAATLLLGTIVVNESVGPVLFRLALARAGEIGRKPAGRASHASMPDQGEVLAAATEPPR